MTEDLETANIKDWRSIVTLIVFIITNAVVLFPFDLPIYIPQAWSKSVLKGLAACHLIPHSLNLDPDAYEENTQSRSTIFRIPVSFSTAPLFAVLVLLVIMAIGRQEVYDGTVGADHINPIDNMVFLVTMSYLGLSLDASGLIRSLASRVAAKGGKSGIRLFFYAYALFFVLGSISGNDPLVDSGTAFLSYMVQASTNIEHPRAWMHTLFAIANIASTILVSSSSTNVVLAGAFKIKFATYTANVIVPVVGTAILLFPFLVYYVFADPKLIPTSVRVIKPSDEEKKRRPVNPRIPYANLATNPDINIDDEDEVREVYSGFYQKGSNIFLDEGSAIFGGVVMAVTVITILAMNAASDIIGDHPVFWVTLPAACAMFCWDVTLGWLHRKESREIALKGRQNLERGRAERAKRREMQERTVEVNVDEDLKAYIDHNRVVDTASPSRVFAPHMLAATTDTNRFAQAIVVSDQSIGLDVSSAIRTPLPENDHENLEDGSDGDGFSRQADLESQSASLSVLIHLTRVDTTPSMCQQHCQKRQPFLHSYDQSVVACPSVVETSQSTVQGCSQAVDDGTIETRKPENEVVQKPPTCLQNARASQHGLSPSQGDKSSTKTTVVSLVADGYSYCQETFPTATAAVMGLPFKFVPFALSMSVLVQALVAKGWVAVLAHIWDRWVETTGTVGVVAGMGFMSVMFCNVSRSAHMLHCLINTGGGLRLTFAAVCRYQHRRHHPTRTPPSRMAAATCEQRVSDHRPRILGCGSQHGDWCQLWRFQHFLRRITCRSALAR